MPLPFAGKRVRAVCKFMEKQIYGLLAEFDSTTEIVVAAEKLRKAGFTETDAFSPFPIHEMDKALGIKRTILPYLVFAGGITGLLLGLALQIGTHVFEYPIIVGGRPHLSLSAFVPPAYELTILLASFTAVFGMLFLNGLPKPYHPVFNVPRFNLATREKFFLLVKKTDPLFEYEKTRAFMESLNPQEVFDVDE